MKRIILFTVLTISLGISIVTLFACSVSDDAQAAGSTAEHQIAHVPILLFHHLAEESANAMTVTPDYFEDVLQALEQEAVNTITPEQLVAFVDSGAELPENPIMITFDDGYESNVLLAAPLLRQYDMCATVFAIGVSAGRDTYKETGVPITPHFSWEQARSVADVISVQSHTYDMHHTAELDALHYRFGVLQREGESDSDYREAFLQDLTLSIEGIERGTNQSVIAYAYPYGQYSEKTEGMLKTAGIRMTFLAVEGENQVAAGDADSLFSLKRKSVHPDTSMVEILDYVKAAQRK